MALIKCPECGNEISDTAIMCPRCGFAITPDIANEIDNANQNGNAAENSRKKIITAAIVIFALLASFLLISGGLSSQEKSVLNDCKNLRSMCKDPSSFTLYGDIYLYNSENVGNITYIPYGAKNSYGTMLSGLAIFSEGKYIADFDDDESDFSSQAEYDKFLIEYNLPYYWAKNISGNFDNFQVVNGQKIAKKMNAQYLNVN